MQPVLTAAVLAEGLALEVGEVCIVSHTRLEGHTPLFSRFKLKRQADGVRVICPACGEPVRGLYRHPNGRGLCCLSCRRRVEPMVGGID